MIWNRLWSTCITNQLIYTNEGCPVKVLHKLGDEVIEYSYFRHRKECSDVSLRPEAEGEDCWGTFGGKIIEVL